MTSQHQLIFFLFYLQKEGHTFEFPDLFTKEDQSSMEKDQKDFEKQKRQELQARLDTLTLKEREVMMKLVQGKSIKVIAYELNITHKTVDNHKTSIMRKMQVHNLVELVHIALFCNLLPPPYNLI